MKRTVSLSEFMPYGAPDLIASARFDMVRALLLSSMLAAGVFLAALPFAPMLRSAIEAPSVPIGISILDLPPPPVYVPPQPAASLPKIARRADSGVPVPVPDTKAPPDDVPPTVGRSDGPDVGPVSDAPPVVSGSGPPAVDALPNRGEYFYVEELPVAAVEVKPPYPDLARSAGVEGLVIVHALVGKDGRVMRVELDERAQSPLLNQAALDAAKRWVFKPAYNNGHPVVVWFAIPFRFVLHY